MITNNFHGVGKTLTVLVALVLIFGLTLTTVVRSNQGAGYNGSLARGALPTLKVSVSCGHCVWDSNLSKRLARGYLNRILEAGLAVDDKEVAEIIIENQDRTTGATRASVSYADIALLISSQAPQANPGTTVQLLGKQLAEKLAASMYLTPW